MRIENSFLLFHPPSKSIHLESIKGTHLQSFTKSSLSNLSCLQKIKQIFSKFFTCLCNWISWFFCCSCLFKAKERKNKPPNLIDVWKSTTSYFEHAKKNHLIIFTALETAVKNTRKYPCKNSLKKQEPTINKTEIFVYDTDPIDAGLQLKNEGLNPGVFTPAFIRFPEDKTTVGEEINLRSGLAFALDPKCKMQKNDFYSLNNHETIYSPNVPVIRHGIDKLYSFMEYPKCLSFISSPPHSFPTENKKMEQRIYTQLYSAFYHHHDSLVLCPVGFSNTDYSANVIAKMYFEIIQKYFPKNFKKIVFALPKTAFKKSEYRAISSIIKK